VSGTPGRTRSRGSRSRDGLLLGVDVGTGSARAGLFTADGRQVGRGEREIRIWRTRPDHVEQSSDDIWQAVGAAVGEALAGAGASGDDVCGIGFDATCSLVAVDAAGLPVTVSVDDDDARNVVVWMDHRAVGDAEAINATRHPVLEFVGGAISPEMQTPKLRWLKRELPDTWRRAALWLDLPDYLTWRATGCEDRSLCTTVCKWTYLGHERRWDEGYFRAIGLEDLAEERFTRIGVRVRVPGELLAPLSERAARELGLTAGTPVAASLIDAHAGALGTLGAPGVEAPLTRRIAVIAGTSACHLAVAPERLQVPGVWGPYYEALTPRSWLLEAGISASGAFLDHVLKSHPAFPGLGGNVFERLEQTVTALGGRGETEASLTHDLHFQPNLLGNRAPLANPSLTGGLAGWRLRDDEEDLARWYLAALQSLAYATRHIVDALGERGLSVDVLIASGGSAASARWCGIHADAVGIPVVVPADADGVLLGSAMLAATAAGTHGSLADAMQAMTGMGRVVAPDPAMRDFHDRKYRVYRRMIEDQLGYDAIMDG
jgi:FGGY-family pentulose kinase